MVSRTNRQNSSRSAINHPIRRPPYCASSTLRLVPILFHLHPVTKPSARSAPCPPTTQQHTYSTYSTYILNFRDDFVLCFYLLGSTNPASQSCIAPQGDSRPFANQAFKNPDHKSCISSSAKKNSPMSPARTSEQIGLAAGCLDSFREGRLPLSQAAPRRRQMACSIRTSICVSENFVSRVECILDPVASES